MKTDSASVPMRSLSYCMEKAIEDGYSANFQVVDGLLQHADSGQSYEPEQVRIVNFFRFEGVSDPEDNSILYIIETNDGRKGTISDAYGTYASEEFGAFFTKVEDIQKKTATEE
ncbi:hypothetical protein [Flavihumibacter sp. ZG627]|uniref:hypothetical protein n=1 Tax=Flavihumibacter sp. ZG627 TaxID=1463156 RepID=UPI0006933620|nr:hypothetical protein [Flavihumibacter sp. ZG627]